MKSRQVVWRAITTSAFWELMNVDHMSVDTEPYTVQCTLFIRHIFPVKLFMNNYE